MAEEAAIGSAAVLGGGFMGAGIAESVAIAGVPVTVRDVDAERVAQAERRIAASLDRAFAAGKIDADRREEAWGRIVTTTSLEEAVAGAELIVEAVPEVLDVKRRVIRELDGIASLEAIIASNTSSIPIAQLAAEARRPAQVVGMHFFAPVPVMGLVEVVRTLDTSDRVIAVVREFVERIGKRPIETKDRSGFIVNMLLVPYLMAAVRMFEEGFATREDIDDGMCLGCGYPMGPLRLCDLIGLDVLYAVCDSLFEEFKRDEYAPPPLLKRMLASGRLGRKTGRGFYEYGSG
jgi:3-hydroxybutyryl-CoA dehydrogenase